MELSRRRYFIINQLTLTLFQVKKYQAATDESLQKGILDAYAGAGAFALTNYIDLGISVLLLWYGGSVVMAHDGRLSVGSLITFQLYWSERRSPNSTHPLTSTFYCWSQLSGR